MAIVLARHRLTQTAIAIRRYERRHGRLPADLESLVSEFLKDVPLDPMDLKPMRYHVEAESWRLYSIGINGVDDGGDRTPLSTGFKMHGVDREDIDWPRRAP